MNRRMLREIAREAGERGVGVERELGLELELENFILLGL